MEERQLPEPPVGQVSEKVRGGCGAVGLGLDSRYYRSGVWWILYVTFWISLPPSLDKPYSCGVASL